MQVEKRDISDRLVYRRLLGYVVPFWYAFLLSIGGYLIYSISNVAFVQLLAYIVDSINGKDRLEGTAVATMIGTYFGSDDALNRIVVPVSMVLIALFRGIGSFCGLYFINHVATQVIHALRCQLFDQMLKLPSAYYDHNSLGHMVARVTYHVSQVTGAATDAVKILIREGFTVMGYLGLLLYLNWRLTLIFFLIAPVIALLVVFAGRRFRIISMRIQNSMGDVTHVASESVQGYRVVRNFGGADYERDRFGRVSNYNRRQSMKMTATAAVNSPVIQLLVSIVLAAMVWFVLEPGLLADMTAGKVIAFLSAAGLLAKPIRQLSEVNATVQRGLAAAKDIFELFDEEVEVDHGIREMEKATGKLEFRNVHFRYSAQTPEVLIDVSFVVEPGQKVAIVGRSGSGKTTLASLIPRFYNPTAGQILIDDVPIDDLRLDCLRKQMAVVTQQVTLFNDTVRRNIAYGDLHQATDDDIRHAATRAYAMAFIDALEEGLDTIVGDDGAILSGGQRQRLAIARAFLKDAPILILDEATSALDSESEKFIQAALDDVTKDRTTLVIAHRLSTIEKADLILVMDGGKVVEKGSHSELITGQGVYAQLHRHQFSGSDVSGSQKLEVVVPDKRQILSTTPTSLRWRSDDFNPLLRAWYNDATWVRFLSPLSSLFNIIVTRRRRQLEKTQWKAPVPVIIVGNINVGGTGKSPLVMHIADGLKKAGWQPGVVSRGYGGNRSLQPQTVTARTSPVDAGDEAVMIARNTGIPVVVDTDRVRAVQELLANHSCNVVISDDGLQHYSLGRDFEIAVIDGERKLGNGLCLPAGPLRESPSRLTEVDIVVVNGGCLNHPDTTEIRMELIPEAWVNLHDLREVPISDWHRRERVHAIAGIGNPERFFNTLESLGLDVIRHPFEDHRDYQTEDLSFDDQLPVLMTEKDAVKCRLIDRDMMHEDYWYLKVRAHIDSSLISQILARLGEQSRITEKRAPISLITNQDSYGQ